MRLMKGKSKTKLLHLVLSTLYCGLVSFLFELHIVMEAIIFAVTLSRGPPPALGVRAWLVRLREGRAGELGQQLPGGTAQGTQGK